MKQSALVEHSTKLSERAPKWMISVSRPSSLTRGTILTLQFTTLLITTVFMYREDIIYRRRIRYTKTYNVNFSIGNPSSFTLPRRHRSLHTHAHTLFCWSRHRNPFRDFVSTWKRPPRRHTIYAHYLRVTYANKYYLLYAHTGKKETRDRYCARHPCPIRTSAVDAYLLPSATSSI